MGLDMYLYRKTYVKRWDHESEDVKFLVIVTRGGQPYTGIDPEKVAYVIEQVGYWRKANAIHKWFVENVQDGKDECQESYVSREQLAQLLVLCKLVACHYSSASDTLPTQSGFFFGGTDYDEWYFKDIEDTIAILEPLTDDGDYYYHSSW